MNRVIAHCLLLLLPSFYAVNSWAQDSAPVAEAMTTRTGATSPHVAPVPQHLFGGIPISTHSDEARKFVELAIDKYENDLLDDAIVHATHATETDPQSALAYGFLSFAARRGTPNAAALARAKALLPRATPEEQLLVRWMTSIQEGNLLPAIMTMNDLLQRCPNDKHVLYLTSEWLYFQQDYDRARQMLETILQIDPNFPPALNVLGHAYLENGNPDPAKAIAALRRYVELQPGQPNPECSLGEVLRHTGEDRGSVEHYGEALQLDPTFVTARVGLADALTLMSDYSNARDQYDRAVSVAESSRDRLHAGYQKALVSLWEGHLGEGRKLLEGLAEKARVGEEPYAQFEIGFARALLAANVVDELAQLKSLESFLQSSIVGMTEADRNASLGAVWREQVRVYSSSGESGVTDQALHQLEELAAHTRDMVIENTYESARGYALFARGDVANAADELATDLHNPLVLRLFILTQEKLGNSTAAEASRTRLKYLRGSTVEWFLVAGSASSKAN
jgi:tetratricopeptide (TPR) repeat protein